MSTFTSHNLILRVTVIGIFAIALTGSAAAQHASVPGAHSAEFVASTAKPFSALMHDAMEVMNDGMKRAPMNGVAEHDFITMMIPHHQGAIDMAKALLLHTKDPQLKRLAQSIITEQQKEINLMKSWLHRYKTSGASGQIPAK